ncbi:uncharacterized protein LOC135118563 [Helicoverpa armigera]|uniref:uncharacterized protein LOC135118563 n=1 Tax=Helicoverpa armigera TaxID=29058 RepID=UPI003083A653
METRSKKKRIGPLPGGDRRGTPGADAGCLSMRSVSGEELSRRTPTIQYATADEEVDRINSPIEPFSPSTASYVPSLSSSPSTISLNENAVFQQQVSSDTPTPEDVVQEALATEPAPAPGTNRARKRWTVEMNKFIWRTYLIATKLKLITFIFNSFTLNSLKFPNMQASRQRLGDQCRAIIRNKLLSQEILDQIKDEVTIYLHQNHTEPNTQTHTNTQQASGQRRRWTTQQNESIIRNYYKITEIEQNRSAYRQPLHQAVITEHPELNGVSEQRISDQLRVIINNKMIPDHRLDEIRNEVAEAINVYNTEYPPIQSQHIAQSEDIEDIQSQSLHNTALHSLNQTSLTLTQNLEPESHQNQLPNIHEIENIKDQFKNALDGFRDINPTDRPYIPKQKTSKKLAQIVDFINRSILPEYITADQNFEMTHTITYCAAYTAAVCNGAKIRDSYVLLNPTQKRIPAWQKRLEKKIDALRRDISRMTEYAKGTRSNRLILLIDTIKNKYRIHSQHEEPNLSNEDFLDTLKQKLNAASSRLKRYVTCTLRKKQNSLFVNNEKIFYRTLSTNTQNNTSRNTQEVLTPSADELHRFWSGIWSEPVRHNADAEWLDADAEIVDTIIPMQFEHIPIDVFVEVLNKAHNWKAPGSDRIHNYWYKKFTRLHPQLHNHINDFLQTPNSMPHFVTQGLTYMIPKDLNDSQNPAKYRPITCLQTIYKILTGCIAEVIHKHITTDNNILAEEQKGCRKRSQGCKEQLIVDSIAMKIAISKKKDINTMYIDYRKAFDSVPHSWLLNVLQRYKIHPQIIHFLESSMQNWTTTLKTIGPTTTTTSEIPIRRGIFQGDALSPLWFCLALNPLSHMLNKSKLGYTIEAPHKHTILTHLMYMDDIKLYSDTTHSLHRLADITQSFSNDIHMEFGIDKCKTFSVSNGKVIQNNYTLDSGNIIEPLEPHASYKYLGFQQARQINQKETKVNLKKNFKHRLNIICRSQLNSRNASKAINSYAIPVLTYSFGIINWSQSDLISLQRTINTTLTSHRKHHPRSCVQRMTLPRREGGRGIIDIVNLHNKQITNLRQYFYHHSQQSTLHDVVTLADNHLTPLNLADRNPQKKEKITDVKEKIAAWKQKSLHGRHYHDLQQPHVDKQASNAWLQRGELFPETEAFMMAIQDQVIDTRNYQKHIMRIPNLLTDTCRRCHSTPETIQHITSACRSLAQTDYKHRHDQVASIVHQHLAHKLKFIERKTAYYKYKPSTTFENNSHRLYWDRTIITDKTIHFNRPDITLFDKNNKNAYLIDIAIPNTHNVQSTIADKLTKYQDLAIELKRQWQAQTIHIVPIVMSSTGVVPKSLKRSLDLLQIPQYITQTIQKAVILNTCRITRKFLTTSSVSSTYCIT